MLVPWRVVESRNLPRKIMFWNHSLIETSICKWMFSGSWFQYIHMMMIGLVWFGSLDDLDLFLCEKVPPLQKPTRIQSDL